MSKPERRPPRLVIGPGFVLAAVFAVVIYLHDRPTRHLDLERPTVAQARPQQVETPELGITPEPAWLLRHAAELGLNAEQQSAVERIDAAYRAATAAESAEANAAAAEVAASLAAQEQAGGLDRDASRAQAVPLSEHSANLAARRHAAWADAWDVLAEPQRDQVRTLRRQHPLELR